MPNVAKYNAKQTNVEVAGVNITSLGEDMISIEKREAFAEDIVGAQGDVVRSENNDPMWDIHIYVQPTSPQLGHLLELKNSEEFFPIWITNKVLGIRAGGNMAMVSEMAEIALGKEAEDIEFIFAVYDGDIYSETA